MEKLTLTMEERKIQELHKLVDFVRDQNKSIVSKMRKIFKVWDNAFKTIGTIVSIAIATLITWGAEAWYNVDGKPEFWAVFGGGVLFLIVLGLLLWITWGIINTFLIEKIDGILNEN